MGSSAVVAPPPASVARRRAPRFPATAREQGPASSTRSRPATPRKERFDLHHDVRVELGDSHDLLAEVTPHRVPPGRPAGSGALTPLGITSCLDPDHRCVERITTIAGRSAAGATFLSATDQDSHRLDTDQSQIRTMARLSPAFWPGFLSASNRCKSVAVFDLWPTQSRGGRSASTSPSRSGRRPSSQGRRNRSPRSRSRPARSPAAGP